MSLDNYKLSTPDEDMQGMSFEEEEEKSKVDDMVAEARSDYETLKMCNPKQSWLDLKKAVLDRCEDIKEKVYKKWDN